MISQFFQKALLTKACLTVTLAILLSFNFQIATAQTATSSNRTITVSGVPNPTNTFYVYGEVPLTPASSGLCTFITTATSPSLTRVTLQIQNAIGVFTNVAIQYYPNFTFNTTSDGVYRVIVEVPIPNPSYCKAAGDPAAKVNFTNLQLAGFLGSRSNFVTNLVYAGGITGPADVLAPSSANYSVTNVTGLSFSWTVSSTLSIASGTGNARTLTANCGIAGSTGTISVAVSSGGTFLGTINRTVGRKYQAPGLPGLSSPSCSNCSWTTSCLPSPGTGVSYIWSGSSNTSTSGPNVSINSTTALSVRAKSAQCFSDFSNNSVFAYNACPGSCFGNGGGGPTAYLANNNDGVQVDELDKDSENNLNFVDQRSQNVIGKQSPLHVEIIPNPAKQDAAFSIALPEGTGQTFNIQIVDLIGKVLYQQKMENGGLLTVENLKTVESGIYFVKIISSNGTNITKKLVLN
jgi:Secretion system C-terminal sorting domain